MDKWKYIGESLDRLKAADNKLYELSNEIGLAYESPLVACSNDALDVSLKTLAMLAGDKSGWIEWYFFECECGKKPMGAGAGEDMRLIDSVDKLRWVVEATSEEGGDELRHH
ncbi:MAG: hypothetical protein SVC26_06615 [Pseudomonadota bacterium]|nr:hypothetical protein [Pseudomonadota bacterium]